MRNNPKTFENQIDAQLERCTSTLIDKNKEYADSVDRLANFRRASDLIERSMEEALGGMLSKHVISIFDMIYSDEQFQLERWDEKIGDAINYLLLLSVVIRDPDSFTQRDLKVTSIPVEKDVNGLAIPAPGRNGSGGFAP